MRALAVAGLALVLGTIEVACERGRQDLECGHVMCTYGHVPRGCDCVPDPSMRDAAADARPTDSGDR